MKFRKYVKESIFFLSLFSVGFGALSCGSRKNEDSETEKKQDRESEKAPLVIGSNNSVADSVAVSGTCEVELKQSSEFDPSQPDAQVVVVFKGKLEERCVNSGLKSQMLIFSSSKLSIPGATCGPHAGEFNLQCQGDILRSDASGGLEIRFESNENQDQLSKLRIKVKYAEGA